MQLLFSFDQDMRVDETLMQTLACQLILDHEANQFISRENINQFQRT